MAALFTIRNEPNGKRENKNDYSISDNSGDSKSLNFSIFDLSVLIFSVLSIIIDICTDIILVVQYSIQGFRALAISTFVLIFFPSLVVQFFSLRWHIVDKTASTLHWVLHFCMLGIVQRYIQLIKAGFAAYKTKSYSDIQKVLFEQSDLCMLHLFESFLESAPQLVLQMYVIVMLHEWKFWTGVSALASLLSLAWAMAAYTKAQRRARSNKNSTTWPGLLLQAIWRTGMLTSRISTLVMSAYCFGNYFFLLVMIHWVIMTVWIIYQKTDFCETYWEEKIYNGVVGVIYCFCFFNLQEGQSRWRALSFYLVIVFQNLTCLTIFLMWFGEKTPKLAVSGFIAVIGGTIIGSTSMLFYYRFFHPSGPIKFMFGLSQTPQTTDTPVSYSSVTLRSLKRIRCEVQSEAVQTSSKQSNLNKSCLSESVVIVEENVLDDTDPDIKILQNWIEESNEKKSFASVTSKSKSEKIEAGAYKRRAICSTVDLVKLLESKIETENESLKLGMDEASSEILSAHDYENLCAVNIARETWGLRSWRGYSDIETWLHDDSTVHDRRLDTLTSTTSSDHSVNTLQKRNENARQDNYMDAIAEDLTRFESEDDIIHQYAIDSLPVFYPLGTLDPIFEETEEDTSNNSADFSDAKMANGSASTLVATIDKIRRNTPIQNRYSLSDGIYCSFSPLCDIRPRQQQNWKKVTFASKLLSFSENNTQFEITNKSEDAKRNIEENQNKVKEQFPRPKTHETNISVEGNFSLKKKESSKTELSNKENIPTVASKINYWNRILNSQNEKIVEGHLKTTPPKKENIAEKQSFLMKVLTPPNLPTFQKKK